MIDSETISPFKIHLFLAHAKGRRNEHRVRVQTIHEALKLYHEKRDMKRKGGMPAPIVLRRNKVMFEELARDALRYADEHKRSARDDRWRMKKRLKWFGDKRADSITTAEIESRLREESWAPATWNRHRALLSLIFRQAIRNGKLTDNPARRVPHKIEHNERIRFLSPAEEKTLSATILKRHPERISCDAERPRLASSAGA